MPKLYSAYQLNKRSHRVALIKQIICDLPKLNPVWHPIGFILIKLEESSECVIRLHIWPAILKNPQSTNNPIHDHVYEIESTIMCGKIGCTNYQIEHDSDDKSNLKLSTVTYTEDGSTLHQTDEHVLISKTNIRWYKEGETYHIERGKFHESIISENELTCTLVKNRNFDETKKPRVIYNSSSTNQKTNIREKVDPNIVLSELLRVKENILQITIDKTAYPPTSDTAAYH